VVQVNAPMHFTMQDRSSEGMQLDTDALGQAMQQQMQGVAERVVAASWRPGGVSHANSPRRR
jgi:hypothetical protein